MIHSVLKIPSLDMNQSRIDRLAMTVTCKVPGC